MAPERKNDMHDDGGCFGWTILCDFDGTISTVDVTDALLAAFGRPGWEVLEARWQRGEIGSMACMAGQVELLDVSPAELAVALRAVRIDPAFPRFVAAARALGLPLGVASDGLDHVIQSVLAHQGIDGVPVAANHLVQAGETRWRLEFPHARADCWRVSGNCKCALAQAHRAHGPVLYIGDGASDHCVAHRADFVFAKSTLVDYVQREGIAHSVIEGFDDALALLPRFATVDAVMTSIDGEAA